MFKSYTLEPYVLKILHKGNKIFQISENLVLETFFLLKHVGFRIKLLPLPPDKFIIVEFYTDFIYL